MSNDPGEFDKALTESKTTSTVGNFPHGSRETPLTSAFSMGADRSEKARGHKSDMDVGGESHSFIVPKRPANKGRVPRPAELVEGRELTKENTEQLLLDRTQSRKSNGRPFRPRSRRLLGVRETVRFARQLSKVRTVCGSSARTDLCGGRSERPSLPRLSFFPSRTSVTQIIEVCTIIFALCSAAEAQQAKKNLSDRGFICCHSFG